MDCPHKDKHNSCTLQCNCNEKCNVPRDDDHRTCPIYANVHYVSYCVKRMKPHE